LRSEREWQRKYTYAQVQFALIILYRTSVMLI